MIEKKKWFRSKTLWLNVIGIAGIILQCEYGFVIDAELEFAILGGINVLLRLITNKGLEK